MSENQFESEFNFDDLPELTLNSKISIIEVKDNIENSKLSQTISVEEFGNLIAPYLSTEKFLVEVLSPHAKVGMEFKGESPLLDSTEDVWYKIVDIHL